MTRAQAEALRDFLEPMLHFDPAQRATAAEMLRHPWLAGPPAAAAGAGAGARGELHREQTRCAGGWGPVCGDWLHPNRPQC